MKRIYSQLVKGSLKKKIVLISGPRQAGKTYLSKNLITKNYEYLNYDIEQDRDVLKEKSWNREKELIIFDEIHKKQKWKTWLKGIYDKDGIDPNILVTGSARMDTFKKGGDSLAGRHRHIRLYPFSLKETGECSNSNIEKMISIGNFPEPYLENDLVESKLWRRSHLDRIIKEDILDLEYVKELKKIELLTQILSERVGSLINYSSIARDLEVSSATIKKWIQILEDLYVVFIVLPYTKNISKSVLKAPKVFFYDTARVRGDVGAKLENLVAFHLLKRNHFLEDSTGDHYDLHYIRDTRGREVDFLTTKEYTPEILLEVKTKDKTLSKQLSYYKEIISPQKTKQVVLNLERELQFDEIKIEKMSEFLFKLEA